jgi:hypothetical protein
MNLNIAICDDDTNDIAIIKKNILQYTIETDNNIVVSSYFSASDLLSDYKNHYQGHKPILFVMKQRPLIELCVLKKWDTMKYSMCFSEEHLN